MKRLIAPIAPLLGSGGLTFLLYGYPLSLSFMLPYLFQGYYDPFWYHLMPLSLHALNGWLVYLLARRLAGVWAAPWAAVLFLSYPLSYQVVPSIDALPHPLVVFFALGAFVAYWEGRCRPSARWTIFSLVLTLLALSAHENGVLVEL